VAVKRNIVHANNVSSRITRVVVARVDVFGHQ